MAWQQNIAPNTSVNGKAGYCLWLQEEAYGTPHLYDDAEDQDPNRPDAWSAAQFKHPDELPPANVAVLVYWTFYNRQDGIEEGHIASSLGDGRIFSSPMDRNFGNQIFNSIDEVTNRINKIAGANSRYLGYSEDLAGVRVAQYNEDIEMIANEDQARDFYALFRGSRDAMTQDELNSTVGQSWAQRAVDARPEIADRNANLAAQASLVQQLQQVDKTDQDRITTLTQQLATMQAQLAAAANLPVTNTVVPDAAANPPSSTVATPNTNNIVTRLLAYLLRKKKP